MKLGTKALFLLPVTLGLLGPRPTTSSDVIAFENGAWFDGEGFRDGTFYSVDGILSRSTTETVDYAIDLAGKHVVPPYADGHTHFMEPGIMDVYVQHLLSRGIFYARDMAGCVSIRRRIEPTLNRRDSIDFIAPNQGFTGPLGHPIQIAQQVLSWGVIDQVDEDILFVIESEADIDRVWPGFLAGEPDFVKIFLVYSELHEERSGKEKFAFACGLDPALAAPIVERAHAAGLEVAAHVYSASDFRTALDADVDIIAHFPGVGYESARGPAAFRITPADARRAKQMDVTVVTTLNGFLSDGSQKSIDEVLLPNMEAFQEAGVRLVIGADLYRRTADVEALALAEAELFPNDELLRMWCVVTPQWIFPGRKIGRLAEGYEASFPVLDGDPLEDFANTQRIALRVKQGQILLASDLPFPPPGTNED